MEIEIRDNGEEYEYRYFMSVNVPLISEDKESFCGKPHLHFHFWSNGKTYWTASLAVHDEDDYDVWKDYEFTESDYQVKVHELLNWVHDMEYAVIEGTWHPYEEDFFPEV